MPCTRRKTRRTALKDQTNASTLDQDRKEKLDALRETYENWLLGAKANAKMLHDNLNAMKAERLREFDNLLFYTSSDILNTKIGDMLKMVESDAEGQNKQVEGNADTNSKELFQEDEVMQTVDQALLDLQLHKTDRPAASKETSKTVRRAPPRTVRKKKQAQQPSSKLVLETPCNTGVSNNWKMTPLFTPRVRKDGAAFDFANPAPQLMVNERGSPVNFECNATDPRVRAKVKKHLLAIQKLVSQEE